MRDGTPAEASIVVPGRWFAVGYLLLSIVLVGTMWVVPYLPTGDGPEWIFATHAENHYADPGTPYQDALIPNAQFASRGMSMVYGPLEAWLGWKIGLQVALSLVVLLSAWGFVAFVHSLNGNRRSVGFLGFPLSLSWALYMGLWPFVVSGALGLFILALAVRWREPRWGQRSCLAILLLIQAISHVFGAVLTGCTILFVALARAPSGQRLRELTRVAATGAPAVAVLVACVHLSGGLWSSASVGQFARLPWRSTLIVFPRTVAPGPSWRAWIVTASLLAALVLAAVRVRRASTEATDRGVSFGAVAFLLAAMIAPLQIPGWQGFSQRFIAVGVALAFAAVPLERLGRSAQRLCAGGLFVASVACVLPSYAFHRRLVALCPDAIAGLSAGVHTGGRVLSFALRPAERASYDDIHAEVPLMNPLLHMGTLYASVLGGVPATSFTGDLAVHPFTSRPSDRPLPAGEHYFSALNGPRFGHELSYRSEVENELASFGMFYDAIAVFGALPSDLALWRSRGYIPDLESTQTFVGHFVPCAVDLAFSASARDVRPVVDVRAGVFRLLSDLALTTALGEDGRMHARVSPAPCGNVALRVRWPTASGLASCSNANADGDLLAEIGRDRSTVLCDVAPP